MASSSSPPSSPFPSTPTSSLPSSPLYFSTDDLPPFLTFTHEESTLPEHHTALSVIDNLDHLWFWDNVFQLPYGFPSCLRRSPSPPCSQPPSPKASPFRSIELMKPSQPSPRNGSKTMESPLPRARFDDMPARFDDMPRRRAMEKERDCATQRSTLRKLRKQLADIHIQVPNSQYGKGAIVDRLMSEELAEHLPHETERKILTKTERKERLRPVSSLRELKSEEHQGIEKLRVPQLETISSGKQLRIGAVDTHELEISQTRWRKRDRRKSSKSLTDIEFDELKGIRDLGFSFNRDDLTPRVVSVFPGLRRQLRGTVGIENNSTVTPLKYRPYLSEAWLIRRPDSPLLNWRVPAPNEEGVDMKEHLKFWARAVASAVRQEC